MKKKFWIFAMAAMSLSAFITYKPSATTVNTSDVDLASVEAIAACEASSRVELNTGYCVKLLNTQIEVCASEGPSSSVRCCGTIDI